MATLLQIENLRTHFETPNGTVKALDGINLSIATGETLGIVGESGCGKTVLALSVMRLIPIPPGRIVSGRILLEDTDLLQLSAAEIRRVRGKGISMIFQEPMTSLNPVIPIGEQIAEVSRLHEHMTRKAATARAIEMLEMVGMPAPAARIKDYPHQMSGGMRQRVMIAMALSCNPRLMLADEPTTALDVTIQAQILDLITRLKTESGTSVALITHDLGVIAEAAEKVAVMYAGLVMEYCTVNDLFFDPRHPYTVGLLESRPKIRSSSGNGNTLKTIPGTVPSLFDLPVGCPFQGRCPLVAQVCMKEKPEYREVSNGHFVRCWKYDR